MVPSRPDRKAFPRVQALLFHRPVTWFAIGMLRRSAQATLGGFRTYTDEKQKKGALLEVEIFLPERSGSVTVVAEIAWVEPLPAGSPARFEVGLQYVKANADDLKRLAPVLAT
jgi:hypothetical protein